MSITDGSAGHDVLMKHLDGLTGELQIRMPAGAINLAVQCWQVSTQKDASSRREDYYYVSVRLGPSFGGNGSGPGESASQPGGATLKGYGLTLSLVDPLTAFPATDAPGGSKPQLVLVDPQFPQTTQSSQAHATSVGVSLGGNIGFFGNIPTGGLHGGVTFGRTWSSTVPGASYQNQAHESGVEPQAAQWRCRYNDDNMDNHTNYFEHAALWRLVIPAEWTEYYEAKREAGADSMMLRIGVRVFFDIDVEIGDPECYYSPGVVFTEGSALKGLSPADRRFVVSSVSTLDPGVFQTEHLATWLDGVEPSQSYTLTLHMGGLGVKIAKPPKPDTSFQGIP